MLKRRDVLTREYGFSNQNAARYLRLNYLIKSFKDLMDDNGVSLLAAVDVSYMTEEEQQALYNLMNNLNLKITTKVTFWLREAPGILDEDKMLEIVDGLKVKEKTNGITFKLLQAICSKYFEGMNAEQMASIMEKAL